MPTTSKFVTYGALADRRVADAGFLARCMSDSKWLKLLCALSKVAPDTLATWKLAGLGEFDYSIPDEDYLHDHWIDSYWARSITLYREIEWVHFPRSIVRPSMKNVPGAYKSQDLAAVSSTLSDLGKFEVEESEAGIKLFGYK